MGVSEGASSTVAEENGTHGLEVLVERGLRARLDERVDLALLRGELEYLELDRLARERDEVLAVELARLFAPEAVAAEDHLRALAREVRLLLLVDDDVLAVVFPRVPRLDLDEPEQREDCRRERGSAVARGEHAQAASVRSARLFVIGVPATGKASAATTSGLARKEAHP